MLGVAAALVFGIGHLLGSSPDPAPVDSARQAAAPLAASTSTTPTLVVTGAPAKGGKRGRVKIPLAVPTGPCQADDISVLPRVKRAAAGGDVTIRLLLSTVVSPACNWQVSSSALALRLTSGNDRIWSSQDCPAAVPDTPVVVRQAKRTRVDVIWSGRRSDAECSRTTGWAEPGYYHAEAAALGGEPTDVQFRLYYPQRPVVTKTAKPKPEKASDEQKAPVAKKR